ncbi:MAG TPA: hypothetical protein VFW73_10220 [Lacipirellulaceae bacterium]|nr:hypothetical protein [Lacipirellulaceae bacterium]
MDTLQALNGELWTCWPVISEAVFLLGGRTDRIQSLLKMFTSGAIQCKSLGTEREVTPWLVRFYDRFSEHAPDLADAALVYLAERDSFAKVFTLDLHDFTIYRTFDNRALEIVGS